MALASLRPAGFRLARSTAGAAAAGCSWRAAVPAGAASAGPRRPLHTSSPSKSLAASWHATLERRPNCCTSRFVLQPLWGSVRQASSRSRPPFTGITPAGSSSSGSAAPAAQSSSALTGPLASQARNAGRKLGLKRKRRNNRPRTVWQKGLGKRMEFYWPKRAHRTRVPLYENSRRHVIWDHRLRRWLVMWYRQGQQVFRHFPGKGGKFERGRARAILFFKQLQLAGKLGRPKPDVCRSGVRGVFYDKQEHSWVARWSDSGLKKYAVYSTQDMGFAQAYREAVRTQITTIRQQHKFIMQRTRWKGMRRPLGTPHT